MKSTMIVFAVFTVLSCMFLPDEARAVRPPLKPMTIGQFKKMVEDADMIAVGTIIHVTRSKTLQPPLETVTIHVSLMPEKILKGCGDRKDGIAIEELYRQYASNDISGGTPVAEKSVTAHIAGPAPAVGRYREEDRVLVFLKSIKGSDKYRPSGTGDYDACLGVFHISPEGVKPDNCSLDETMAGYAESESSLVDFIISIIER